MSRIKKTAYLSSSQIVTTLSTLAIAVALSRLLATKAEYATYQQTLLVYTFLAPLLALGLPAASFYFLPRNRGKERAILINSLAVLGISASAFSLFCLTIGRNLVPKIFDNPSLENTIPWLALFGPATLVLVFVTSSMVAVDRAKLGAIFSALYRVFLAVSVVVTAIIFRSAGIAVTMQAVICFAAAIIAIGLLWRITDRNVGVSLRPTPKNIRVQLTYAVPLGLGAMLEGMALGIDKVIVSALCEPEEYAVFVNGAMEVPLIAALTVAAGAVMLPEIVTAFSKNDRSTALSLWQLMVRRVSFLLLPAGFLFFLVAEELMIVLYSNDFKESAVPFRIYMLMLPARVAYFGMLFQGAGKTHLVLIRSVITLLLNTVITYLLVRKFGMAGAAWGTVAVVWLFVIPYCLIVCSRFVNSKWYALLPYRYIFSVAFVSGTVAVVAWLISNLFEITTPLVSALVKGSLYCSVTGIIMFVIFRDDFRQIYNQLKVKIR